MKDSNFSLLHTNFWANVGYNQTNRKNIHHTLPQCHEKRAERAFFDALGCKVKYYNDKQVGKVL